MMTKVKNFLTSAQFQGLLIRVLGASGWWSTALLKGCAYLGLPVPDPSTQAMIISGLVTSFIEWGYGWYRDHPNNLAARLIKQLNGDNVSPGVAAAVVAAATPPGETK